MYAQYGKGQLIPPTSIFDVTGAQVADAAQADAHRHGAVRIGLEVQPSHARPGRLPHRLPERLLVRDRCRHRRYELVRQRQGDDEGLRGRKHDSRRRRVLRVYLNGTVGSAKYNDTGLWAQNTPKDTETLGLTYNQGNWNFGLFNKRVGRLYNDNGAVHQAFTIDAFNLTNLFFNYTLRGTSKLSQSRIRLAVNNLTDSHAITGVPKGGISDSRRRRIPTPAIC